MVKKLFSLLLCISFLIGGASCADKKRVTAYNIYVSVDGSDYADGSKAQPFKTISRAKEKVRLINANMSDNITVHIGEGVYKIDQPLLFDERDKGTNGKKIIYKADGEVVIDAGTEIKDWVLHDAELNIYKAEYGKDIDTRQLYVDGQHKQRAKDETVLTGVKNLGAFQDGLTSTNLDLADYKNQSSIEIVYSCLWTAPRCLISSIKKASGMVFIEMKQPYWKYANNKMGTSVINFSPWYLENAYEILDEPGEWYLDKTGEAAGTANTFYYIPEENQDMSKVKAEIPLLETLMSIEGSNINNPAGNLVFEGIIFKNGTYLEPNDTGIFDAQNNILREYRPEDLPANNPMADSNFFFKERMTGGNIRMAKAKNVTFTQCVFTQMGNAAIYMNKGCQDNLIEQSHFYNISGQAIQIGEVDMFDTDNYMPKDERLLLKNNDIINNVIHDIGTDYFSAAAIGATYVQDTDILHNVFENLPYSAIHIGYGWARIRKMGTPKVGNNNISYNYFNNLITKLYDGGAVYTLGPQYSADMPTYITNNYIRKQNDFFGAIYLDEGSDYYIVKNTVVEDSPYYFGCNGESTNTVDTMYVTKYWGPDNKKTTMFTRADSTGKSTMPTNIVWVDKNNWNAAALKIMTEAGLQSGVENPCKFENIGRKYF